MDSEDVVQLQKAKTLADDQIRSLQQNIKLAKAQSIEFFRENETNQGFVRDLNQIKSKMGTLPSPSSALYFAVFAIIE